MVWSANNFILWTSSKNKITTEGHNFTPVAKFSIFCKFNSNKTLKMHNPINTICYKRYFLREPHWLANKGSYYRYMRYNLIGKQHRNFKSKTLHSVLILQSLLHCTYIIQHFAQKIFINMVKKLLAKMWLRQKIESKLCKIHSKA